MSALGVFNMLQQSTNFTPPTMLNLRESVAGRLSEHDVVMPGERTRSSESQSTSGTSSKDH